MYQKFTSLGALFLLLTLLPASYAHAVISPPLGVQGTPKRSDAKRPNKGNPCGAGVNIASALDTSTAVLAAENGEVKVTAINFNAGADGSRKVSAKVDPSGTGKTFVDMVVTVNGDPAPKEKSAPQDVVAQLPADTKCTGGATKDRCLVQFVSTRGFGNCVAVSQGATSVSNSPSKAAPAVAAAKKAEESPVPAVKRDAVRVKAEAADGSAKKGAAKKKKADKKNKKKGAKKNKKAGKEKIAAKEGKSGDKAKAKESKKKVKRQAGTRAARALLADLEGNLREWKTKVASTEA